MCYHPFSTVINAKSIGANFQFRNGLTIGNKGNDNTKTPVIGSNVTVGANVVIIGDIVIGDHVVIGAGSVVVKDVPSNCVIAGNPARIIKQVAL
jgi:serine O-acetyltransferase